MAPGSLAWSISSWNAAPIRSRRSDDRPTFSGSTVGSERPQAALAAKTKTNTRALILFTVHLPAVVRRPSTSYSRHVRRFKWHGAGEADRTSPDGKRLDGPGDQPNGAGTVLASKPPPCGAHSAGARGGAGDPPLGSGGGLARPMLGERGKGQADPQAGVIVVERQAGVVQLGDRIDQAQAEAVARGGPGGVEAHEAAEHAFRVRFGDAGPVVGDGDHRSPGRALD